MDAMPSLEELILIEYVEKKLREAKFFLNKMSEHERMAFDDKKPFEFFFSAFLSAGRSVGYYLQHKQKGLYRSWGKDWTEAIYRRWRKDWEATLPQPQQGLIKFMIRTRDIEVHEGGTSPAEKTEKREF